MTLVELEPLIRMTVIKRLTDQPNGLIDQLIDSSSDG